MLEPNEVAAMVRLHEAGWGAKRLAREFGCARNTVRHYLREGGPVAYRQPERRSALDGLEDWLRERFFRHDGNADVIRQELGSEHGVIFSLRHVRATGRVLAAGVEGAGAGVRGFETPPGRQLQIDFGEARVWIGGEACRVHLFVATLGFSRRLHVRASLRERQADWFAGMEETFGLFGGVPAEVLLDNARALVDHHNAQRVGDGGGARRPYAAGASPDRRAAA